MNRKKFYRVRCNHPITGERMFVVCYGYRDALRVQKQLGGKIV